MERESKGKKNKIILGIEGRPRFGSICSEINNTNYFVPFSPKIDKQQFKGAYIQLPKFNNRREAFYMFINEGESKILY
jgi:hypothetical protein